MSKIYKRTTVLLLIAICFFLLIPGCSSKNKNNLQQKNNAPRSDISEKTLTENISQNLSLSSVGGDADCKLLLQQDNTFKLTLFIFEDKEVILYTGKWIPSQETIFLYFDREKLNPKLLFVDGNNKIMPADNAIEIIDDYTIKIINLNNFYVWGFLMLVLK